MLMVILCILVLCSCACLCYMRFYATQQLIIQEVKLHGNITRDVTIVQFSDTHFKRQYREEEANRLVTLINQQNADIIIFSGDLMDHYQKYPVLRDSLPPILKRLNAKVGKISVYGNHDIGGKAKYVYKDMMEKSGFHVLCNDSLCLSELDIACIGIDDACLGYEDTHVSEVRLQTYQILVSHEPDIIDQMDISKIDLILCGHTHGGQIAIPYLCTKILPKGGRHYRKGFYQIGNTKLFVSSGVGTTKLNLRLWNPPEIVVYTIQKENETNKERTPYQSS